MEIATDAPEIELISYIDPINIFYLFKCNPWTVFLDSSYSHDTLGRYSFIAIDPFKILICKDSKVFIDGKSVDDDVFSTLKKELNQYNFTKHQNHAPFQGGIAGFFGYDLCQQLEKISIISQKELKFPNCALGFFDLVIGFDNILCKAWIFSSGFPEKNRVMRKHRAAKRIKWLKEKILNCSNISLSTNFSAKVTDSIQSNFTKESYIKAVKKAIHYIYEGDIFEANLSQKFSVTLPKNFFPFDLYLKIRKINPAPFSAYINTQDLIIVSASPERFLQLTNGEVETRPIKGTRPRGKNLEQDKMLADELCNSEKDRAENAMIVDLMRNDLSKVSKDNSVEVSKLFGVETYATVHHLVSVVKSKLQSSYNAIDLLRATFPGGSITGAPKIRAMEIIYEIEPNLRGPYCGSAGYIGFDGDMDTSIMIRTYTVKNNLVEFQAGGAITSESDPEMEYQETLTKAAALQRALLEEV